MATSPSFRSILDSLLGEGWWRSAAKQHLLDEGRRLKAEQLDAALQGSSDGQADGLPTEAGSPQPADRLAQLIQAARDQERPLGTWFGPQGISGRGAAIASAPSIDPPSSPSHGGDGAAAASPALLHPSALATALFQGPARERLARELLVRAMLLAPSDGGNGGEPLAQDDDHEEDALHGHDLHDHRDGLCAELPLESSLGAAEGAIAGAVGITPGTPLVAFGDTFRLSSNPTARTTIFLDFDGHTTTGTSWNDATMGASFFSPAYNTDGNVAAFSNSELTLIQQAWQRVAADFAPFDVNVTTLTPPDDWLIKSSTDDPNYGMRVVMTSYGPSSSTAGGIAYINSFNWNSDTPCFVYNTSLLGVSEAVSHEVGHTLGLSHDGTLSGSAYYSGHGSGETGWASIMGVGYYKNVTTWDNGTFYNSNNGSSSANYNRGADDLAIISGYNGFGYVADQEGNSQATANALSIQVGSVSQFGTIETRSDLDWYSFTLGTTGSVNLTFDPYWFRTFVDADGLWGGSVNPYYARVSDADPNTAWADNGANLDLAVELYNSANALVGSSNPAGLAASLNLSNLAPDTYFLKLDGVGFGTPTVNPPTGYSDYGSLGSYLISGTISGGVAQPQISLALGPNLSVSEDGAPLLTYTFTRTGDTSSALAVNVTLAGTATLGTDYSLSGWSSGTVTFAAGQATALVSVDPTADTIQENDETVQLQLNSGSGYTIATTAAVSGTISNDDVPSVSLTLAPASVSEDGVSNLIYTFSRSYASAQALVVSYTVGGTATIGTDYTGPSTSGVVKTITIAASASTAALIVDPVADTVLEANETVALSLFPGFGYSIGTPAAVVGTITNDDLPLITLSLSPASVAENSGVPLVYTFTRDGLNTSSLTVNYTVGGTATNGSDYTAIGSSVTFAAGSSTATVAIQPINETVVEADETVSLSLASSSTYRVGTTTPVTGTITNDDLPVITLAVSPPSATEAGTATLLFTFARSGPTTAPLTVSYAISGTASNGVDYTSIASSVTFAAGSSTATVVIDPLSDALVENDETVALTLQPGAGYAVGTPSAVVGTIVNSDPPVITLSVGPLEVRETGVDGSLLYTFSRSGATAEALTVSYAVGGTATNGLDYTTVGTSVTFAAGAATTTLLVTPLADALSEGSETVELTLMAGSGYTIGTTAPVVGTIVNVDLPQISLTVDPLSVLEDGGTPLRFTFHRDIASSEPLTVAYSVGGTATSGSDFAALSGSLTFAAGATEAVLDVLPAADGVMEADETITLSLVEGPTYRLANPSVAVGTVVNDDLPQITLTLDPSVVDEDGSGTLVYRFARTGPTTAPLAVAVEVGGTAANGVDYATVATSVLFAVGETFTTLVVDPIADGEIEPDESVSLTLLPDAAYTLGSTAPVVGTIRNDDWPVITLQPPAAAVAEDSGMPLSWTFQRSGPVEAGLTVAFTAGGTATSGVDYAPFATSISFAPGQATATLSITPTADALIEPDETIALSLAPGSDYTVGTPGAVSGTILNDDFPEISLAVAPAAVAENSGSALVYTFTRTGPTSAALTVAYGVAGTATLGSDYSGIPSPGTSNTVTFAPGAATATVSVAPIGDTTVEANETVALTLQSGSAYRVATTGPVVGTILNDDLPSVTLAVAPSSTTEGSPTNLVFTLTRSVATADPLNVTVSVGGTATAGVDYTGIPSGSAMVTIAAGASSAQVVIDPTDDTTIESNETVVLSLVAGSGYTLGTTAPLTATILDDDVNSPPTNGADTLIFTPSQDALTGLGGADTFKLIDLKNSLFVSGTTVDKVTSLVTSEDRFDSPLRTTSVVPTSAGSVTSLSTTAIASLLKPNRFSANGASTFTFGTGSGRRTFLGINDGVAGYQAANDAIIEITGYTGSLGSLLVV